MGLGYSRQIKIRGIFTEKCRQTRDYILRGANSLKRGTNPWLFFQNNPFYEKKINPEANGIGSEEK